MASKGNGSSEYMATAGTITIPVGSYSYSFWYLATHVPNNSGGTTNPMGLDHSGGTQDIGMTYDNPSGSLYKSFAHIQAAGGVCRVQIAGTPAANVWNHYCVTWDGATLSLYINGTLNNTAAGSNPPNVAPVVSVLAYNSGASGFDDGSMGELTVWNVTLSAADALALGTGTLATTIHNAAIIFYSTLNTGDPGAIGPALTNHSTTINTTYFQSSDGGAAIGGDPFLTVTDYGWIMDGGSAIGGDQMLTHAAYGVLMDGGLSVGGDQMQTSAMYNAMMTGGLKVGGDQMTTKIVYGEFMDGGIAIGGSMDTYHILKGNVYDMTPDRGPANTTR